MRFYQTIFNGKLDMHTFSAGKVTSSESNITLFLSGTEREKLSAYFTALSLEGSVIMPL